MRICRVVGNGAGRCDLATHPTHSGLCFPICLLRDLLHPALVRGGVQVSVGASNSLLTPAQRSWE